MNIFCRIPNKYDEKHKTLHLSRDLNKISQPM